MVTSWMILGLRRCLVVMLDGEWQQVRMMEPIMLQV